MYPSGGAGGAQLDQVLARGKDVKEGVVVISVDVYMGVDQVVSLGIESSCYVDQIGPIQLQNADWYNKLQIEASLLRCPDQELSAQMQAYIAALQKEGDTIEKSFLSLFPDMIEYSKKQASLRNVVIW